MFNFNISSTNALLSLRKISEKEIEITSFFKGNFLQKKNFEISEKKFLQLFDNDLNWVKWLKYDNSDVSGFLLFAISENFLKIEVKKSGVELSEETMPNFKNLKQIKSATLVNNHEILLLCGPDECLEYSYPSMTFLNVISGEDIKGAVFSYNNIFLVTKDTIKSPILTKNSGYESTFLSNVIASGQIPNSDIKFWVQEGKNVSVFSFQSNLNRDPKTGQQVYYKRIREYELVSLTSKFDFYGDYLFEKNQQKNELNILLGKLFNC